MFHAVLGYLVLGLHQQKSQIKNLQLFNLKYLMVIIKINLNTLGQLVVILIILVSLFAKEELEIGIPILCIVGIPTVQLVLYCTVPW